WGPPSCSLRLPWVAAHPGGPWLCVKGWPMGGSARWRAQVEDEQDQQDMEHAEDRQADGNGDQDQARHRLAIVAVEPFAPVRIIGGWRRLLGIAVERGRDLRDTLGFRHRVTAVMACTARRRPCAGCLPSGRIYL